MNKNEKIISVLSNVPKNILINCAEKLIFNKKIKNPLELELEELTKILTDPNLDDFEGVMKRIKQIKELLKHASQKTPSMLIIPGAEYYGTEPNRLFSIVIKREPSDKVVRDLRAILKENTLEELDYILLYLGIPQSVFRPDLYAEDEYAEEHKNYTYSQEYKNLKNQKLILIRDIVQTKTASGKTGCIARSKVPLRDYQVKAIEFINSPSQNSLLVVHGTGTGKTLTALAASQCYLDKYPNDRVVVISPSALTGNFAKEMPLYGGRLSSKYNFYSFTKFVSLNKGSTKTPFDVYLRDEYNEYQRNHPDDTHDEIINQMSKYFYKVVRETNDFADYKTRANKMTEDSSYDCKNVMLIIDEAHNLRNMGTSYEAIFKCAAQCKKLLLLTATPFVNRLHDFLPLINMMYRDEDITKKGKDNKIPLTITNEVKYHQVLNTIHRFLSGKVTFLNEKSSEFFPRVIIHKHEIIMSQEFSDKYEKALMEDREFGEAPEAFYQGFRRAVNAVGQENNVDKLVNKAFDKLDYAEYINQKLDMILELVEKGRQTLVFTNWVTAGVNVLENIFNEHEITYDIISGAVLANTRLQIVENFNNKKYQVLIITLAGSEGLDLKEESDVIILDPVWNPAVMEQIIGRAVRYRSHIKLPIEERLVDVHQLVLETQPDANVPSGDEILYGFITEKQKQLDDVIVMLKNASI